MLQDVLEESVGSTAQTPVAADSSAGNFLSTPGTAAATTSTSVDESCGAAAHTPHHQEGTPAPAVMVAMKGLTKKASLQTLLEKKTSVGNLTPLAKKQSAAELGIKSGSAWIKSKPPEIKNDLKPTEGTPKSKSQLSGFALLKVGAKVLDKQIDDEGAVWVKYQAVDKGPVFYAQEGSTSAGQWHKPPIYQDDLDEDHGEEDLLAGNFNIICFITCMCILTLDCLLFVM